MFVDIYRVYKRYIKQHFCNHEYRQHKPKCYGMSDYLECTKCGRVTQRLRAIND